MAAARETPPDLILMDVQLPKMSGLDATRQLRADARTAAIPIIVITSFALSGDAREGQGGGRDRLSRQALQPARAAREDPRVRARGLSFEKEAHHGKRSTRSRWSALGCRWPLPVRPRAGQEEQFTPEFTRSPHAPSTPSTRRSSTAPDSVKRGQWFEVTVTVGAGGEHPSLSEHHVRYIALYKDTAEIARVYLHPVYLGAEGDLHHRARRRRHAARAGRADALGGLGGVEEDQRRALQRRRSTPGRPRRRR